MKLLTTHIIYAYAIRSANSRVLTLDMIIIDLICQMEYIFELSVSYVNVTKFSL